MGERIKQVRQTVKHKRLMVTKREAQIIRNEVNARKRQAKVPALGRRVTNFEQLDTFAKPTGLTHVELITDEVTANCPVTSQPDYYTVTLDYHPGELCVESKACKLYFQQYRDKGLFCEAFAAKIAQDFTDVLGVAVRCAVQQKSRGGVSIIANAVGKVK